MDRTCITHRRTPMDLGSFGVKNWHPAEPNGEGREKCALVKKDGRWRDYPCTSKFYFICERK